MNPYRIMKMISMRMSPMRSFLIGLRNVTPLTPIQAWRTADPWEAIYPY